MLLDIVLWACGILLIIMAAAGVAAIVSLVVKTIIDEWRDRW